MSDDQQLTLTFAVTLADRFETFHEANPNVYVTLVRLAREWVATTGRHKLAIATLFERARWDLAISTNDPEFRLNNNFRAFYARLIHEQEPDLDRLFELRTSEADHWIATHTPKERAS